MDDPRASARAAIDTESISIVASTTVPGAMCSGVSPVTLTRTRSPLDGGSGGSLGEARVSDLRGVNEGEVDFYGATDLRFAYQ